MTVKPLTGSYVKYMFHVPGVSNWSEYRYQKLFRLLYGYTQVVTKSNGARYVYHRPGILSFVPYIKAGKNAVIVPQEVLQNVITFFKKGRFGSTPEEQNWKVTYYVETVPIKQDQLLDAFECLMERLRAPSGNNLDETIAKVAEANDYNYRHLNLLLYNTGKICNSEWFGEAKKQSERLQVLHDSYITLKKNTNKN
ncbi:MAG: hypothetical protein JXA43_01910 [Candidatus Diapherotrites archaeon]|nr:hypothetical protein [Candidatus Diapherotrites archaeon]